MPCDPVRLFSSLYCGAIALQTLLHYPEQLRFFETEPARLYGPPPLLLWASSRGCLPPRAPPLPGGRSAL